MINLKEKQIILQGEMEKIKSFEVWWLTPNGLYSDLDVLIAAGVKDYSPVPVAVSETKYEVIR